jgi:hypothetical protein
MRKLPFRPVIVATRIIGQFQIITSVEQASDFLAHDWPTERGPKHLKARIACLDALEKSISVEQARQTFVEAAKESGIYLTEGEALDVKEQSNLDRRSMDMRNLPFPYVTVLTDRPGKIRNICSVEEAAEWLVMYWPIEKGEKLMEAR